VFTEPPFGWGQRANDTESAELTPSDGATDDRFGAQVGISGTTVFAGSFLHQVGPNPAQGAVYFFNRPGFVWSDEHEGGQLTASDGAAREGFADTLAVSDDLVAAGAPIHAVGQNLGQGAVYLFGVPPTITTVTPAANATYTQGQAVLASYVCSAATATALTSCSGPVAAGARLDTSTVGAHSFAVRALDSDGSSATQTTTYTVTAAPTTTAPSITNVHESATRWRTGRRGGQSRRRAPIGTTFSFTLDQPAAVTLAFTRGSRIAAGALEVKGRAGDNQVRFRGRLSSGRTLRPGAYAVTVTATNGAQQRTTHRPLHFRIVR
jgi:hypothetical protein